MLIARVVGEMVATQKHPSHEGRNLLLVQPLELDGSNRGDAVVALDAIGAGVGDKVLLTTDAIAHRYGGDRLYRPSGLGVALRTHSCRAIIKRDTVHSRDTVGNLTTQESNLARFKEIAPLREPSWNAVYWRSK